MSFGEDLKEARLAAGLSQSSLGEIAGMSASQIGNYEAGKNRPKYETIERLEAVLGVRFNVVTDKAEAGSTGDGFTKDAPPTPKRRGPRGGGKAPAKGGIPLAKQLELPYLLLSQATANRIPVTSGVINRQAKPCAEAWDTFLLRYPALREKIEQGMIAGDVVGLIMAHVPIITAAREEIAAMEAARRGAEGYDPQGHVQAA